MSSPPPPPPPPPPSGPGPSSTSNPPPSPPPGPPPSSPSINYFFGFVVTFAVLLLLFIGCGLGSWRQFRLTGTAWDLRLQDMDADTLGVTSTTTRKRRRRPVRPRFFETWTSPTLMATHAAPCRWESVQPIAAALMWSRSNLVGPMDRRRPGTDPDRANEDGGRSPMHGLRSYIFPRPTPAEQPKPRPAPRPPPEAIKVAVMIAMPSRPLPPGRMLDDESSCVGQVGAGEYQVGVMRIPWPKR